MELRHLKYFKTVAEELHFGKAATRLFIAQPPLSRQIKELENELGVLLFLRKNKQVSLTEAGKYLLKEVDAIFSRLEDSKSVIRQLHKGESSELNIGYISSVYQQRLADALIDMRSIYPIVKTSLFEMPTFSQIQALEQGTLDVGILRAPVHSSKLVIKTLFFDPFMVVVPKLKTKLKQYEIADYIKNKPFVFFNKNFAPHFSNKLIEICERMGFVPEITHEVNNTHSILQLVGAGLGVTILPASLKDQYAYLNLSFLVIDNIPIHTEVVLAYNSINKSPALSWFIANFYQRN